MTYSQKLLNHSAWLSSVLFLIQLLIITFTFLLSLCKYLATCLASSVLPVKHQSTININLPITVKFVANALFA